MHQAPRLVSIVASAACVTLALFGPVEARQAPTAKVTALAWMAGAWGGEANGLVMEEHWTAPSGGTMIGMHRDVKGNRTAFFEFLRIEEREGTLHYIASPKGGPPTTFPLKELGAERVVFENATHDFPQRIIYWKDGDSLRARVEGTVKGKLEAEEWRWQSRQPPAASRRPLAAGCSPLVAGLQPQVTSRKSPPFAVSRKPLAASRR